MPTRKNTSRAPAPQPHPLYIWPRPGDDLPRLPWSAYLRLIALQISTDYPGAVGQFLASHVIALALQANGLGATSPDSHERLAQAEADRESAWIQALESAAADSDGHWEPNDDVTSSLDGHDDQASQYWVADDPENEVYRN